MCSSGQRGPARMGLGGFVVLSLVLAAGIGRAQNPPDLSRQLQELRRQNEQLQQQLRQQQELIDKLTDKVSRPEGAEERRAADRAALKEGADVPSADRGLLGGPWKAGNVVLSGEARLAFFRSEADGHFPNAEFRVDEAKRFLDARVWKDVFFFTELNLTQRFVFMTGDVVNERVQAFLEERQKICLAKPFTLVDFRATVKKVSEAS